MNGNTKVTEDQIHTTYIKNEKQQPHKRVNPFVCVCFSVLVTQGDGVKISDFGTSKELSDKSTKMSFAGTVAWMAPEVIRNEPVSEKVDIW